MPRVSRVHSLLMKLKHKRENYSVGEEKLGY